MEFVGSSPAAFTSIRIRNEGTEGIKETDVSFIPSFLILIDVNYVLISPFANEYIRPLYSLKVATFKVSFRLKDEAYLLSFKKA
jgi:hypothetical protein